MSSTLTALSPLDGRYAGKTESLRPIFSEFGLMHAPRAGGGALAARAGRRTRASPRCRRCPTAARAALLAIGEAFSEDDAARIKAIERTTNHDVKAVEYFLKEKVADNAGTRRGQGVRPLRLHQRGHQQPRLRADAARRARRRAAAALDALDRDAARDGARARRAADAVAHARPDRLADHARQGARQRRRAPASASARQIAAVELQRQDQRRGRQLQRARRRLSRGRLAGVRAALRRSARPGLQPVHDADRTARLHRRDRATRCAAPTPS